MPERKLAAASSEGDSDLSPPPDSLLDGEPAVARVNGYAPERPPSKAGKARRAAVQVSEVTGGEQIDREFPRSAKTQTRNRRVKVEVDEEKEEVGDASPQREEEKTGPKKKRQRRREVKEEEHEVGENGEAVEQKVKKKRKTQAEKEAELVEMPLAARTVGHKLNIGAHVSAAGGVHQSVLNSVHIGANAFALFLKSQRKWANPPLQDGHCDAFHENCKHHQYDQTQHAVPHGSYLVNLAHTDKARSAQAYDAFLDDLKRCERLGIRLYNFHPGNDQCGDRQKAIAHLASSINKAHSETSTVITLLENMAAGGNVIGSTFEDLRDTIALISNKGRIGVCLDTCHSFAAGYDLRTPDAFKQTMDHFDDVVGFKYLRALHINDSKAPFASHRDLHANIGTGFLGLCAFHNIVNEPRFAGLPLVLETPIEVRDANGTVVKDEKGKVREDRGIWAQEIKLLERLVGMETESEEFLALEAKLLKQGEPERKRLADQIERKKEKEKKAKSPKKRRKGKKEESSDDESSGAESGENGVEDS